VVSASNPETQHQEVVMYVVTGATGNTGSVVANHLLAAGKKVRGTGRSAERLQWLVEKGGEPLVADLTDTKALEAAFTGAEGVYVMLPPSLSSSDFRAHQNAVTESIAAALERSRVTHAVTLSSVGADKTEKTGPVVGLHRMEERLNRIAGLTVLHLRAGYFMENTLAQVSPIKKQGMAMGPLRPELKVAMIAARDIGAAAAEALVKHDFQSHQTRELLGPREITMSEAATMIGKAIGQPDLKYVQPPEDQIRAAMQQMGMSADFVGLILELAAALNSGHMAPLEARSARNTTPTTFETFVREEFLPQYRSSKIAA
jgi:uncharacterized protein YbjT (DUF2867 family)